VEGEPFDEDFTGHPNPPFARQVLRILRAETRRVLERLEEVGKGLATVVAKVDGETRGIIDPDLLWPADAVTVFEQVLRDASRVQLTRTIAEAGQAAIQAVRVEVPEQDPDTGGFSFSLQNDRPRRYLQEATGRIAEDQATTYTRQLRDAVLEGVEEGESIRKIRKRIEKVGKDMAPWQAERIARTETAFASSAATEMGWEQSGVVTGKQYVLAPDGCPICQAVAAKFGDGKEGSANVTRNLGQSFFERGQQIEVDWPLKDGGVSTRPFVFDYSPTDGDPQVPPTHPNCRCSVRPVISEPAE
jgi:hypothetical protein